MAETTEPKPKQWNGPGRKYKPGQSGNPAGRPKGSRHVALLALDKFGADNAQGILNSVVKAAKKGDMRAAEILLYRLWPARKGRPLEISLPVLKTAADLVEAQSRVVKGVAEGEISPEEAQAIATVLESWRKATELADFAARLERLERSAAG